jgi:hypothetical protein
VRTCRFGDAGLVWAMRPRRVGREDSTKALFGPGATDGLVVLEDDAWRRIVARRPEVAAAATTVWLRRVSGKLFRMVRTVARDAAPGGG